MIVCEKSKNFIIGVYIIKSNSGKVVKKIDSNELKPFFMSFDNSTNGYVEADKPVAEYYREERYNKRIVQLIRIKYSLNDEIAINRQRFVKEDEFNEYNSYVESCKAIAKTEIYEDLLS